MPAFLSAFNLVPSSGSIYLMCAGSRNMAKRASPSSFSLDGKYVVAITAFNKEGRVPQQRPSTRCCIGLWIARMLRVSLQQSLTIC